MKAKHLLFGLFLSTSMVRAEECRITRGDVIEEVLMDGTIQPVQTLDIVAPFDGAFTWVIADGTSVKTGEPIARIDTFSIEGELGKAIILARQKKVEIDKLKAEQELEKLKDKADQIKAEAELEAAELQLETKLKARDAVELTRKQLEIRKQKQMREFYSNYLKELEKLADRGAYSQTELEETRLKVRSTEISLKRAEIELQQLIDGQPLEIEQARREVEKSRLKLEATQKRVQENIELRELTLNVLVAELQELDDEVLENQKALDSSEIQAPASGILVLETHWSGTGISAYDEGHQVQKSERFARLALPGGLIAELKAHEADAGRLRPGQKASIQILPLGKLKVDATLLEVGRVLDEMASWNKDRYRLRTLRVLARFDDIEERMRPKMSLTARIRSSVLTRTLRLPATCLTSSGLPQNPDGTPGPKPIFANTRWAAFDESEVSENQGFQKALRYSPDSVHPDTKLTVKNRQIRDFVPGAGEMESTQEIPLVPALYAKIETIAQSGMEVKSGETVITLETEELITQLQAREVEAAEKKVEMEKAELQSSQDLLAMKEELRQARQKLEEQDARLKLLDSPDPELEQKQKEIVLRIANLEKQFETQRFDVQSDLKKQGFLKAEEYQQNFEKLQAALIEEEVALLELDLAQSPKSSLERKRQRALRKSMEAEVSRLETGLTIQEEISKTSALFAKEQSELALFEAQRTRLSIEKARIPSPVDGVFIVGEQWKNRSLEPISEGDQVGGGLVLGKIVQMKDFLIRGRVAEPEFHRIRPGQKVEFALTTRPGSQFQAEVIEVSPIPVKRSIFGREEPVVELSMKVLEKSPAFQPGTSVTFELMASEPKDAVMVPARAVHQFGEDTVVFTSPDKTRKVRTGMMQEGEIEILDGLKPGETIWMEGELQ